MTPPRPQALSGARVTLVPAPQDVARAVSGHDHPALAVALAALGLRPGRGWPHDDSADALRPLAEHGTAGHVGTFLVVLDGAVVGDCGWLGAPDERGDVEIGYGLAAPCRGQGLGTDLVDVLAAWAGRQTGVRRVTAEVLVGNEPSRRLLTRLGFTEEPGAPPYLRYVRPVPPRGREGDNRLRTG
jgi:RimJ/RimL family protein N-acetyltransferase